MYLFSIYLNGVGGDLDLVEFAHGVVPVDEVRRSELVQRFHSLRGVHHLPVQLVLRHVHGEGLLTCRTHTQILFIDLFSNLKRDFFSQTLVFEPLTIQPMT